MCACVPLYLKPNTHFPAAAGRERARDTDTAHREREEGGKRGGGGGNRAEERRGKQTEVKTEEQVCWQQSQTPPLLPGRPCPDYPCTRRRFLSKMTDCLSLYQSHCLMSSAARCHGDRENGAGQMMDESVPSQQHKVGLLNSSELSAWRSLMSSHLTEPRMPSSLGLQWQLCHLLVFPKSIHTAGAERKRFL